MYLIHGHHVEFQRVHKGDEMLDRLRDVLMGTGVIVRREVADSMLDRCRNSYSESIECSRGIQLVKSTAVSSRSR